MRKENQLARLRVLLLEHAATAQGVTMVDFE